MANDIIFRKNALPVTIANLSGAATLEVDGIQFQVNPDENGNYKLPLKGILCGKALLQYKQALDNMGNDDAIRCNEYGIASCNIKVTENGTSKHNETYIFAAGGTISTNAQTIKEWLTCGPSVRKIYPWSKVFLCIAQPPSIVNPRIFVKMHIRESDGELTERLWQFTEGITSPLEIIVRICKDTLPSTEYRDETDMFDIWWIDGSNENETKSHPIRFIIEEDRPGVAEFIYRNSLGFIDCIHSSGAITEKPEYEPSVFTSRGVESELSVKVNRWIEVNTGRCCSEEERYQWMEFFESSERYVLTKNDQTIRKIIVSEVNCEQQLLKYGTAVFKYKLAEPLPGGSNQRNDLPDYE